MTDWILSVLETEQLRKAKDGFPEASLYRRDDLVALVYRNPSRDDVWHLMLSVRAGVRDPEIVEAMQAIGALLPPLDHLVMEFGILDDSWNRPLRCFRVTGSTQPEVGNSVKAALQ